jgi:uncharacterized protein
LKHGIFDEASLSVIASNTVREIARLAGQSPDMRRFRPNVVVRLLRPAPFQEDEWLGGVLSFGEGDDAPAITVTMRDVRCSMVNLDPDSASPAPEVLKAVVRAHRNNAGTYGAVGTGQNRETLATRHRGAPRITRNSSGVRCFDEGQRCSPRSPWQRAYV